MMDRREARKTKQSKPKLKEGAKMQLILMVISIFLMVFSVTQVYYLAKHTLGYSVNESKLKVYRWVHMLLEPDNNTIIGK